MHKQVSTGLRAGLGGALVLGAVSANAATAAFTAALTDLTADVGTYGAGLVALGVVAVAFMVALKFIKKLRGAA